MSWRVFFLGFPFCIFLVYSLGALCSFLIYILLFTDQKSGFPSVRWNRDLYPKIFSKLRTDLVKIQLNLACVFGCFCMPDNFEF